MTLPLLAALQSSTPTVVPADTAWMLVATALVLLMTPALAFFYGGLVRSKSSLNTMMMSFAALGVVGIVWALAAYSLAFSQGGAWIGDLTNVLLRSVGTEAKGTIPHVLFMAYQGTFAIITAALISGAIVERMRFGPYLAFIALWTLFVYAPVAHWVWGGGWLMSRGRARLRRRNRRPHQRRHLRARGGGGSRRAKGLRTAGHPSPQRPLRAPWRRPALVRMVRLQRRQRARGE